MFWIGLVSVTSSLDLDCWLKLCSQESLSCKAHRNFLLFLDSWSETRTFRYVFTFPSLYWYSEGPCLPNYGVSYLFGQRILFKSHGLGLFFFFFQIVGVLKALMLWLFKGMENLNIWRHPFYLSSVQNSDSSLLSSWERESPSFTFLHRENSNL